jgi:hypothetical protein
MRKLRSVARPACYTAAGPVTGDSALQVKSVWDGADVFAIIRPLERP